MESFKFNLAIVFLLALALVHAQNSIQDYLDAHNKERALLGLKPLIWNETIAQGSAEYAEKRKDDCALIHSNHEVFGENIGYGSGDWTAIQAVGAWNEEKPDYDYNTNSCTPGKMCGHYTQVVWNTSEQVGCARVRCTGKDFWWYICRYYPAGNYVGEKPY